MQIITQGYKGLFVFTASGAPFWNHGFVEYLHAFLMFTLCLSLQDFSLNSGLLLIKPACGNKTPLTRRYPLWICAWQISSLVAAQGGTSLHWTLNHLAQCKDELNSLPGLLLLLP